MKLSKADCEWTIKMVVWYDYVEKDCTYCWFTEVIDVNDRHIYQNRHIVNDIYSAVYRVLYNKIYEIIKK